MGHNNLSRSSGGGFEGGRPEAVTGRAAFIGSILYYADAGPFYFWAVDVRRRLGRGPQEAAFRTPGGGAFQQGFSAARRSWVEGGLAEKKCQPQPCGGGLGGLGTRHNRGL